MNSIEPFDDTRYIGTEETLSNDEQPIIATDEQSSGLLGGLLGGSSSIANNYSGEGYIFSPSTWSDGTPTAWVDANGGSEIAEDEQPTILSRLSNMFFGSSNDNQRISGENSGGARKETFADKAIAASANAVLGMLQQKYKTRTEKEAAEWKRNNELSDRREREARVKQTAGVKLTKPGLLGGV